jgi:hypothetical protein
MLPSSLRAPPHPRLDSGSGLDPDSSPANAFLSRHGINGNASVDRESVAKTVLFGQDANTREADAPSLNLRLFCAKLVPPTPSRRTHCRPQTAGVDTIPIE